MRISNFFVNVKEYFKSKSTLKIVLEIICWLFLFLTLFSIHSLSFLKSIIPIITSVCFSICAFLYICLYGKLHINLYLYLIAFLAYAFLITLIFSRDFLNLKTYLTIILLYLVSFEYLINVKHNSLACFIYILSILAFAFWFIFHYRQDILYIFKNMNSLRLGDYFAGINYVANTLLSGVVACFIYMALYKRYVLPSITAVLASICILSTGSRMAFVGVLLTIITFVFIKLFKKHKIVLFAVLIVSIIAMMFLLSLPAFSSIRERMLSLFNFFSDASSDGSTAGRMTMFISGMDYWFKYIFTGLGAGGFSFITGRAGYSHSTISETLCNFGILGALILCFPIILTCIYSKKETKTRHFLLLFLFGFLLIGLVGTSLLQYKILYFLLALMYSVNLEENKCLYGNLSVSIVKTNKIRFCIEHQNGLIFDRIKDVFRFKRFAFDMNEREYYEINI